MLPYQISISLIKKKKNTVLFGKRKNTYGRVSFYTAFWMVLYKLLYYIVYNVDENAFCYLNTEILFRYTIINTRLVPELNCADAKDTVTETRLINRVWNLNFLSKSVNWVFFFFLTNYYIYCWCFIVFELKLCHKRSTDTDWDNNVSIVYVKSGFYH